MPFLRFLGHAEGLGFFSRNTVPRYRPFFAGYSCRAFYPQNTPKIRKNGLTRMVPYTHMATLGHFNMTFEDSLGVFKTISGDFDFFEFVWTPPPKL